MHTHSLRVPSRAGPLEPVVGVDGAGHRQHQHHHQHHLVASSETYSTDLSMVAVHSIRSENFICTTAPTTPTTPPASSNCPSHRGYRFLFGRRLCTRAGWVGWAMRWRGEGRGRKKEKRERESGRLIDSEKIELCSPHCHGEGARRVSLRECLWRWCCWC